MQVEESVWPLVTSSSTLPSLRSFAEELALLESVLSEQETVQYGMEGSFEEVETPESLVGGQEM